MNPAPTTADHVAGVYFGRIAGRNAPDARARTEAFQYAAAKVSEFLCRPLTRAELEEALAECQQAAR